MHIADCIELYLESLHAAWTPQLEQAMEPSVKAGGPGSGRRPESSLDNMKLWQKARGTMENLANQHKPHEGMCNLNNPVCRAYVDMKEENPGFMPKGKLDVVKGR